MSQIEGDGVATAISIGGPGAVMWMWLTGVFGIATKYSEAVLAVKYRITTKSGAMAGGPMYVLERGLKVEEIPGAYIRRDDKTSTVSGMSDSARRSTSET